MLWTIHGNPPSTGRLCDLRTAVFIAQDHAWRRRSTQVDVQQTDSVALGSQSVGELGGHGGLSDTALAGENQDGVGDIV